MSGVKNIFPEPILKLPEADIPISGIKAYLSQGIGHQIIFMQFEDDVELPEHNHAGQWGIVLEGRIDLIIDGIFNSYHKGDRYYIPEGVRHSGKIYAGYADITFFDQKDRYQSNTANKEKGFLIEHTAIWVKDLDGMKDFYCKYFDGTPNKLYHNPDKQFKSYFISFKAGTRLELMHMPGIPDNQNNIKSQYKGIIHIAFSVGSKKQVDELTARLKEDGHCMVSEPRTTGDGYYESCVLDPEGNIIEITI